MQGSSQTRTITWRISAWYAALVVVLAVFILRLFHVQVISHDQYNKAANASQLKEREIAAERGIIEIKNGNTTVPLVLNENKYTIFADPVYIAKPDEVTQKLQPIIGGDSEEIKTKLVADSRYQVLAKKMDKTVKEKIEALEIKGVGAREESYRTYPQGTLAAQLLGFVNDEGEGKYGVEQYLDSTLRGKPGKLKAITDAAGVPLVANRSNVEIQPEAGGRVELTIDLGMQQRLEEILKSGLDDAQSKSGSALVLDARTGAVRAMANYPTYNPAEFYKVEDAAVFANASLSSPMEVGSIVKPLVIAAALDQGVIDENWSYFDPGVLTIDGAPIRNVTQNYGQTPLESVIRKSLNTGSTTVLMQMGGGKLNETARTKWYEYLVNHYRFGQLTNIEQGYEASGSVPHPTDGFGLDIQYANTTFGQGMNLTILQVAAAFASAVNGGTYYQPYLVDKVDQNGSITHTQPKAVDTNVVSAEASRVLRNILESSTVASNRSATRSGYSVGGKTGTAQIPRPEGGYYENKINGTYIGYIGGDMPEYVTIVRVNEPGIPGLAGSRAAAPVFSQLSNMLIDSFGVTPKSR